MFWHFQNLKSKCIGIKWILPYHLSPSPSTNVLLYFNHSETPCISRMPQTALNTNISIPTRRQIQGQWAAYDQANTAINAQGRQNASCDSILSINNWKSIEYKTDKRHQIRISLKLRYEAFRIFIILVVIMIDLKYLIIARSLWHYVTLNGWPNFI